MPLVIGWNTIFAVIRLLGQLTLIGCLVTPKSLLLLKNNAILVCIHLYIIIFQYFVIVKYKNIEYKINMCIHYGVTDKINIGMRQGDGLFMVLLSVTQETVVVTNCRKLLK